MNRWMKANRKVGFQLFYGVRIWKYDGILLSLPEKTKVWQ